MKNAADLTTIDRIHALVGRKIEVAPMVAGEGEIKKAIDQFYGYELSVDGILHEIETGEIDYRSLDATEYEQSVVAEFGLLTGKKVLYVCNVDEGSLPDGNQYVEALIKNCKHLRGIWRCCWS